MSSSLASRLFSVRSLWIAVPLVLVFGTTVTDYLSIDTWWMIATGKFIADAGAVPSRYPFTFAPQGPEFVDTQWLAQLIYYAPYPVLGLQGIALLNALILTASFAMLMRVAWERSASVPVAAICTLMAVTLTQNSLGARAQSLGFLCFILTCWMLWSPVEHLDRRRIVLRMVALGAIEALWANTHGSFFLGPFLTALLLSGHLIDSALHHQFRSRTMSTRTTFFAVVMVLQAAATLITPFGLDLYRYIGALVANPAVRSYISEWTPTSSDPTAVTILVISGTTTLGCMLVSSRRQRPRAADVLILLGFGMLAWQAVRNVAWLALISTPILAAYAVRLPWPSRSDRPTEVPIPSHVFAINAVLLAILLALAVSLLPWLKAGHPLLPVERYGMVHPNDPQAAASFLLSLDRCGRVFAPQWWSGYLNWRLWPHCQTMIDIPVEVFQPEVILDFKVINAGEDTWDALLDQYRVDVLLLSQGSQGTLLERARQSPSWSVVYEDHLSTILSRAQGVSFAPRS